jgi:hypothetical protein
MGLAAGGGGALAGVVVGQVGYAALGLGTAVVAVLIGLAAAFLRGPEHPVRGTGAGPTLTGGHTPSTVDPADSSVR